MLQRTGENLMWIECLVNSPLAHLLWSSQTLMWMDCSLIGNGLQTINNLVNHHMTWMVCSVNVNLIFSNREKLLHFKLMIPPWKKTNYFRFHPDSRRSALSYSVQTSICSLYMIRNISCIHLLLKFREM